MTSFAVVKNEQKDRLISWPHVQNSDFLDPPKVDLPDPFLLSRLRIAANSKLSGFALDIANMFHNIKLPVWLVPFFPLHPVRFGNLPGELQRAVMSEMRLQRRPQQSSLLRPTPEHLAYGFKWAVYIAHTICRRMSAECICSV